MTTIAVYNFNNALEGAVVYDDTGNHNGSVVGTVPLVSGPIGSKCRRFPGAANNYISIPHHADFTATIAKTYEIWFTTETLSSSYRYLIMKLQASPNTRSQCGFLIDFTDTTKLDFNLRDASNNLVQAQSPTGVLASNTLYYAVGTWNPTTKTCQLFINGACVAETTNAAIDTSQIDCTEILGIGAASYTGYEFNSRIHAVRISNVVKTGKEIYDTYMATNVQERV
jgi:hypothetical protein